MAKKKVEKTPEEKTPEEKPQEQMLVEQKTEETTLAETDICQNNQDDTDNQSDNYKICNNMSLDEIQEFLNRLAQELTKNDVVYVDLTEAETISTPIVQAIISLNRFAGDNNKTIKWQNPSTGFSDAFNNLGFYSEMMKLEFA